MNDLFAPDNQNVFDILLGHPETGKGLRPQSDQATQLLRSTIAGAKKGTPTYKTMQSAVRAPGTTTVDVGDLRERLMGKTRYRGGNKDNPSERVDVIIDPWQMVGEPTNTEVSTTIPHEMIHAMRATKGLDTQNQNIEESLPRTALGAPISTWYNRQFDKRLLGTPDQPMTMDQLPMLENEFKKSLE